MRVLGMICEYNPLHAGHAYHIEASRMKTNATHTVCVMSGQFVQRGEPAIADKWARAEMALHAGIDLVLELPVVFSCASAEFFAYGAVRTLHHTGIVDYLSFGSEQGELDFLQQIATILADEPPAFKKTLKQHLNKGISFPAAREEALLEQLPGLPENILSKSNNILSIEYLKALLRIKSTIIPITVKRQGAPYQDTGMIASFSSATAIRRFFHSGGSPEDPVLSGNLPSASRDILNHAFTKGRGPVFPAAFSDIILHRLRFIKPHTLRQAPDVNEGLENRLIACAKDTGTLEDLIEAASTSRYPATRIRRILTGLLWGITRSKLRSYVQDDSCGYLRVLGFSEKGRALLQRMQTTASLPVIMKVPTYRSLLSGLSKEMFEYDIAATDAYVLGFSEENQRRGNQDFTTPIVRL